MLCACSDIHKYHWEETDLQLSAEKERDEKVLNHLSNL